MSLYIAGADDGDLEHGSMYLHTAADLWSLVDERRGGSIRRWITDEWAADDANLDIQIYEVSSLRRLLELLDGLDDALRAEITDHDWRMDATTAAQVRAREPALVDTFETPSGTVHTLENRVSEVHQVEALVKRAVATNRRIEIGER
jgi:hypothetical protein